MAVPPAACRSAAPSVPWSVGLSDAVGWLVGSGPDDVGGSVGLGEADVGVADGVGCGVWVRIGGGAGVDVAREIVDGVPVGVVVPVVDGDGCPLAVVVRVDTGPIEIDGAGLAGGDEDGCGIGAGAGVVVGGLAARSAGIGGTVVEPSRTPPRPPASAR